MTERELRDQLVMIATRLAMQGDTDTAGELMDLATAVDQGEISKESS